MQSDRAGPRDADRCVRDLQECNTSCQAGDPNACYEAALEVEALGHDPTGSEALFLRACALGHPSGCTNSAAAISNHAHTEAAKRCAARTFEATCALKDAWGCVMYGRALAHGEGVAQDLSGALRALAGGCKHGPEDPACAAAEGLIKQIEQAQQDR